MKHKKHQEKNFSKSQTMNSHLAAEALPTTQNLAAVIISQEYLSKNQWKYKVGLAGYEKQLHVEAPESASYVWHNICLPANAYEGNTLELSSQRGRVISDLEFVSFGLP
ncbi:uncharacterized protein LOC107433613 [Ziziphus jujuba]|uniref:Uncharacterized protein LOC107433613 n=1 Tax=Ziziphus jujuba TaxID=326968 RepID=A0ABM3ZVJ0_ZIZJJ|nr:uncharacterized protein LOC107433613 [Ziziphus jujuba]